MKLTSLFTSALTLLALPALAEVGYRTNSLPVPHRSQPVELHIWYPAQSGGSVTPLGKNAVFTGVEVTHDAAATDTPHPLVLLSHGSGGNAVNIGWIATYLANQGMVVIAPNHPGTTSRDSIPQETIKIWERPDDMHAILEYAEQKLAQNLHIDTARIGVVGFSLGGHTALSLVGAQADHVAYIDYCALPDASSDCVWIQGGGVNLADINTQKFEQDNTDPRITAAVAVDPALAQAYQSKSLGQIEVPLQIINLGAANTVPLGINAMTISQQIPIVDYKTVVGASHFSFLGQCTEIGENIISSEGEDPICSETSDRTRGDIHNELEHLIGGFLAKHL